MSDSNKLFWKPAAFKLTEKELKSISLHEEFHVVYHQHHLVQQKKLTCAYNLKAISDILLNNTDGYKFHDFGSRLPVEQIDFIGSDTSGGNCTNCNKFNEYQCGPFICYECK